MAYEGNQYSYFQNIKLDSDGALIVNVNGGARTAISTPVLYSAITVDTNINIYLDLDGSLGNTFVVDFDIVEPNNSLEIVVQVGSITNFNDGDNLYLTCNFSTSLEGGVNNFYFYFPTYLPTSSWNPNIQPNYPKSISFNAPIWNNIWLFPGVLVEGSIN